MMPANVPPAVTHVSQRYQSTNRGVVGFQLHRTFEAHAGPSSRHEDLVLDGILVDGVVRSVRVLRHTIDGKDVAAAENAKLVSDYEHPKYGDNPALPFDPKNLASYTYRQTGPKTFSFASSLQDAAHGSGSFTFDSSNNVVSYTYVPNVMPPHATGGRIWDRRSAVLPNFWAVTDETAQYKGRYSIFSGGASIEIKYYGFRRLSRPR